MKLTNSDAQIVEHFMALIPLSVVAQLKLTLLNLNEPGPVLLRMIFQTFSFCTNSSTTLHDHRSDPEAKIWAVVVFNCLNICSYVPNHIVLNLI